MKTTLIAQMATLAFAFSVATGPILPRQADCEEVEVVSPTGDISPAATTTSRVRAKTTKTRKSKTSKTKTSANAGSTGGSGSPTTTADSNPPAETTAGSGGSSEDETPTATGGASATNSSASSAPTAAPTGGSGGGGGAAGSFPAASGTSVLAAVQTIAAGQSFDGGMVMFDRGVSCSGQAEGGSSDAVFILEEGASLSNVIIGPNQIEGVHCNGGCSISNVWWDAVCEDAFSIKEQSAGATTTIKGGGARGASDKVVQHNGAGTVSISDFLVEDFGKLYRACGNCAESFERHVIMSGITASSGSELAGINSNWGDTATITNSKTTGVKNVCTRYNGVAKGSEPTKIGSGADGESCIYGSDVTIG